MSRLFAFMHQNMHLLLLVFAVVVSPDGPPGCC